MNSILEWIQKSPQTNLAILGAAIALGSAVFGGLFSIILWPSLKVGLGHLWSWGRDRFARHAYQNSYLRHLINRFRRLPLLPTTLVPVTDRPTQELDSLYVEIQASGSDNKQAPTNVAALLKQSAFTVVLGDPGAGKTTMIQYLTLLFARALRNQSADCGATDLAQEKQKIRDARNFVETMLDTLDYPLPIPLTLSRLKPIIQSLPSRSILDIIQDDLNLNDALKELANPREFFQSYLDAGSCIFLFDAFDELGSKEARDSVAQRLGEFAAAAPAGNRFVVTSRIIGYEGQLSRYGFKTVVIQPLSSSLIQMLVEKWYGVLGEPTLADSLLQTMRMNRQLAELSINPMLLSLIVLVQYIRRVIPDRRHLLYDECIKILVERRYAPVSVQAEFNSVIPADEALRILKAIAYSFQMRRVREMPREELEKEYIAKIISSMPFNRAAAVSPAVVLKNIEERSQLLIERGLDRNGAPLMAFSHLTFQEYLASVHLTSLWAEKRPSEVSEDLISEYEKDPQWWEETASLYAAQLEGVHQNFFFDRLRR